jgi:hypothetical protein
MNTVRVSAKVNRHKTSPNKTRAIVPGETISRYRNAISLPSGLAFVRTGPLLKHLLLQDI